jgi:DNA-binding MarR family transcriptional regulator
MPSRNSVAAGHCSSDADFSTGFSIVPGPALEKKSLHRYLLIMSTSPPELSIDALKALAHPLRQRMLARLQRHGPATSAELAVEFGADRGAASYHLRQLARYGFIQEDASLSAGRRKYWRSVPQDIRLPRDPLDAETAAAAEAVGRGWITRATAELDAYLEHRDAFGSFAPAAMHSFGATLLTADELAAFGEEYLALLNRWRRDDPDAAPGSRRVTVIFHAFPTPDPTPGDDPVTR